MKRLFYICLIYLPVFYFISCVKSEVEISGDISGTVVDAATSNPIAGCIISISDSTEHKFVTSADGLYQLRNVVMGRKVIHIESKGYIPINDTIVVQASKNTNHDFRLSPISSAVVQTKPASDIDYTSAVLCASIISDGGGTISERGFYFEIDGKKNKIKAEGADKDYSIKQENLLDGKIYKYAAYVVNEMGESVGSWEEFETFSYTLPSVRTISASIISCDGATISGELSASGNSDLKEYGFLAKESESSSYIRYVCTNLTSGRFSVDLTNLKDGTKYVYKAYATNKKGEECGDELSFQTLQLQLPVVATGMSSDVQYTSFLIQGSITDEGGAAIESKGFCYATTSDPTIENNNISCGQGPESFSVKIQQLQPNTTYYVKAYAKNRLGYSYGAQVVVTTKAYSVPSVTTNEASDIELNGALLGGVVTDNGGQDLMERGLCYSTSSMPTVANSKVTNGSSTGAFTVKLNDLNPGTTYYARAYAKNTAGVGYGNQVVFQTLQYALPSLSAVTVSNIGLTNADLQCSVSSVTGASVTACGFCVSTTSGPTIYNSTVVGADPTSSTLTASVAHLQYNTTYYVRAFATNVSGMAYSAEKSFKTGSTNLYFSISSTQKVLFSPGNLQYRASTNTWQFASSQTSYIGQGNSNISSSYSGWIDLFGFGTGDNPTLHSTTSTDYSNFVEWGNNVIGNDPAGTWRTLDAYEFYYILEGRTNAASKRSMATVGGVKGIILLPDNWSAPSGITFVANAEVYSTNIYSSSQWSQMEAKGAVFLPAAGSRSGTTVNSVGQYGCYWKNASCKMAASNDYYGQALYFHEDDPSEAFDTPGISSACGLRSAGYSVRLVKVLQ